MKKAFFLFPFIFALTFTLSAQDQGKKPFPTDLTVSVDNTTVLLRWEDSPRLSGEVYHLYRFSGPLTTENLSRAVLVNTVDRGIGEYRDKPPGGTDWYYAVTAEDSKGHYSLAIPYVNATPLPVRIDPQNIIREVAARVTSLTARPLDDSIIITFVRDRTDRAISLYRSTSPITTADQLNQSLLIAVLEGDQHTWKDNPVPGIGYYYAALDRELLTLGGDRRILESGNYTVNPAVISLNQFLDNPTLVFPVRKAPLPVLQLENYYTNLPRLEINLPERQPLNPKLEKSLSTYLTSMAGEPDGEILPHILTEDEGDDSSPLEMKLKQILGEYFIKERWDHAERALLLLLSEGDGQDYKGRIHYYRGQCFFYQEEYEQAYLEFLLSRDSYYTESEEWMETLLNQFL